LLSLNFNEWGTFIHALQRAYMAVNTSTNIFTKFFSLLSHCFECQVVPNGTHSRVRLVRGHGTVTRGRGRIRRYTVDVPVPPFVYFAFFSF
jgi:hypothetical protein